MDHASAAQLFVTVVESGSFSAAARLLGVTPSNVSRQISNLETELGARLLHRTTRKLSLSEAGELYYQSAKTIVAEIEHARDAVSRLAESPAGDLHITAEADLTVALIAPILPDFLAQYPKVRLRISMSSQILDLVQSGIDLAVRMGHLESSSLIARKIGVSRSQLYASPRYLSRHGTPVRPEDLEEHQCLSFRVGPGKKFWRFETENGTVDAPITGRINADSLMFLKEMAIAGCGIAMLPAWAVRKELEQEQIVPVLREFTMAPPETPISAAYPDNRLLAPKVRAFIDFLSDHIRAP